MSIFSDIHFWLLLSFIVALSLLYKFSKASVNTFLNDKINSIKEEISNSERVLSDAILLLNKRKLELNEIKAEQQDTIIRAKNKADSESEKTINVLNNHIKNSKASFNNYLLNEEEKYKISVQSLIIKESIKNIKQQITETKDNSIHSNIIESSIKNITHTMDSGNTT